MKTFVNLDLVYIADLFFKPKAQKNFYSLTSEEQDKIQEGIENDYTFGIDVVELEKLFKNKFEYIKKRYL